MVLCPDFVAQLLAGDGEEAGEAGADVHDGMGLHETLLDHEVLHVDLGQDLPQKLDSDEKDDTGQDDEYQATPDENFYLLSVTESWDLEQRKPCAHSGVECDVDCPYLTLGLRELAF